MSASDLMPNPALDPEHARRVQEEAARRGLGTTLASRVYMQIDDVDELMWVLDADDLPTLTVEEQVKTAELGLGIATSRTGPDPLVSVQRYLQTGKRLWLLTPSSEVGDWRPLMDASELQMLITNGEPLSVVDLSRLSKLRHLAIEGENWKCNWSSPNLKVLLIGGVKASGLPVVRSPIEFLSLNAGRGLVDLSAFADLSNLRTLFVTGAGVFDARALSATRQLTVVVFDDCLGVNRVDVFAKMPSLLRLTFDNVGVVFPADSLERIGVEVFEVFGNYSFDERFSVPGPKAMIWRVPPLRPLPVSRSSWLLTKHNFELSSAGDEVIVSFSDWKTVGLRAKSLGVKGNFDSTRTERVFRRLLDIMAVNAPASDSEGDRVVFVLRTSADVDSLVGALVSGWNDDEIAGESFTFALSN